MFDKQAEVLRLDPICPPPPNAPPPPTPCPALGAVKSEDAPAHCRKPCLLGLGLIKRRINHGESDVDRQIRTRYTEDRPVGKLCTPVVSTRQRERTCFNGMLGPYGEFSSWTHPYATHISCLSGCVGTRGSPGVAHGGKKTDARSRKRYKERFPVGPSCDEEVQSSTRESTCSDGNWGEFSSWTGYSPNNYVSNLCTPGCDEPANAYGALKFDTEERVVYEEERPLALTCKALKQVRRRTSECKGPGYGPWSTWSGWQPALEKTTASCSPGCRNPMRRHDEYANEAQTRVRYSEEKPKGMRCQEERQERTRRKLCRGGDYEPWLEWSPWSGSYKASSCVSGCPTTELGDGDFEKEKEQRTRYREERPTGAACEKEVQGRERHRYCIKGNLGDYQAWTAWTGDFTKQACKAGCVDGDFFNTLRGNKY